MSYAFDIKMICGSYVYFSTFTSFDGFGEKFRERRKPSTVNEEKFVEDLKFLGHSVFGIEDLKGLNIWLRAKGWAVVKEDFAKSSMSQWLRSRECVSSPVGIYTDIEIVSPKTLKRSYGGKMKQEIIERDSGACLECGSTENLTMQHVIPYAHGGETTSRNLVTLCESCNQEMETNITFSHSDAAGLHRDFERSVINHNWYSKEQRAIAIKITQNLMQSRCEVW